MAGLEHTVQRLGELPRDNRILTGRIAYGKDDNGQTRKYTIGEKLGEGGMGVVYKGIDEQGRTVALKLLDCKDPEFVSALKREARLMSEITHPNIRQVFDFYENIHLEGDGQEPMPMLVMEYVPGHALDVTKVNAGNFCKYFVQMADSLEFLHSQGCIHRDIKPENFIITDDDQVKLCDFGVSRIVDEHTGLLVSGGLTAGGTVQNIAGTRAYLPKNPEELTNPDKRTDLYSLGLVLYQMILGDASKFPDVRAESRAEKAAKEKQLPMPEELAEAICDLTLEERSERPADIAGIKEKRRELYTAIEGVAGLPVYWTKFCEIISCFFNSETANELREELRKLDKNKRIEAALNLVEETSRHIVAYGIPRHDDSMFRTVLSDFFALQSAKQEKDCPKNKEDAELEIQVIHYCLKNNKQIAINNIMEWTNRIKKYQSQFNISAAEELGLLNKVIEGEQETVFNDLFKAIESRGELLCVRTADIRARISEYASRGQLTQEQADKLSALLDKPKNTEAEPEKAPQSIDDIKEKYKKLAESLEGKTVTQEFQEAFAMAAYKDEISREYIDDVLLNTIERVRKKSFAERIKWRIKRLTLVRALDLLVNGPKKIKLTEESNRAARKKAENMAREVSDSDFTWDCLVYRRLKSIARIGRKSNIFVKDLIEKNMLEYVNQTSLRKSWLIEPIDLENTIALAHKYRVDIASVLDAVVYSGKTNEEYWDFYSDLKQKYPNAFKEAPKFEDLERMVEGERTKKSFLKESSSYKFIIGCQQYILGAGVGMIAGILPDLILSSNGLISWLGINAGLATVAGLRAHTAWKKEKEIEKEKHLEQTLADEENLPKDYNKLLDMVNSDNVSVIFPAMLKQKHPAFKNLARAVKCCGGIEIKGADREQIGEEIRKYTLCSGKQRRSYMEKDCHMFLEKILDDRRLLSDIQNPKNIGVITRFDIRKDFFRRNYLEMDITFYEKKQAQEKPRMFSGTNPADTRQADLMPEPPLEPAKEEPKQEAVPEQTPEGTLQELHKQKLPLQELYKTREPKEKIESDTTNQKTEEGLEENIENEATDEEEPEEESKDEEDSEDNDERKKMLE